MEHYVATSMASYLAMMTTSNYPGLATFIDVVVGISVVIGFIVIFQAMYTAVMERTREIGILKAMGASKLYIVNVVLRETVLLALSGIVLGIIVSLAARAGLAHRFPLLQVVVEVAGSSALHSLRSPERLPGPCIRRSKRPRKTLSTRSPTNKVGLFWIFAFPSPLIPGFLSRDPRPKIFLTISLANLRRMHDTAPETAML